MFESIVQTIKDTARKMADKASAVGSIFARPVFPTVEIESRIQTLYIHGLSSEEYNKTRHLDITEIVIHGTGGGDGTAEQFVAWQLSGEQATNYNKGIALVHYVIGRDGKIIQTIDPEIFWTWHSTSYMHDQETIGIELCNPSASNSNPYTDQQYKALAGLCAKIISEHGRCKQIQSHNWTGLTYSNTGKACPGSVFIWDRFMRELDFYGVPTKRIQQEVLLCTK
jgi:hypothetical protein